MKKIFFLIIYVLGAVEGVWGNLATNNYNDPWNKWFKKSTNQPSDNTRHILIKVFAQGLLLPSASIIFLA